MKNNNVSVSVYAPFGNKANINYIPVATLRGIDYASDDFESDPILRLSEAILYLLRNGCELAVKKNDETLYVTIGNDISIPVCHLNIKE
jgi:hypothetical protein